MIPKFLWSQNHYSHLAYQGMQIDFKIIANPGWWRESTILLRRVLRACLTSGRKSTIVEECNGSTRAAGLPVFVWFLLLHFLWKKSLLGQNQTQEFFQQSPTWKIWVWSTIACSCSLRIHWMGWSLKRARRFSFYWWEHSQRWICPKLGTQEDTPHSHVPVTTFLASEARGIWAECRKHFSQLTCSLLGPITYECSGILHCEAAQSSGAQCPALGDLLSEMWVCGPMYRHTHKYICVQVGNTN